MVAVAARGLLAGVLVSLIPTLGSAPLRAEPLALVAPGVRPSPLFERDLREQAPVALPSEHDDLPAHLRRQVVDYPTHEAPGTVVVDTPNTYIYYVLGGGRAIRYGVGVGRDGFRWSGVERVSRVAEWPDWIPPAEMIARQPYLPRFMAGGETNPLGARALYLGNSAYRIHGTNDPSTIGKRVSSGCIRMTNDDVVDLYKRVSVGTKVVVLPDRARSAGRAVRAAAGGAAIGAVRPVPDFVRDEGADFIRRQ